MLSFKKFKLSGYMYNQVMLSILWTLVDILNLKGFQSHVQIYVSIVKHLCKLFLISSKLSFYKLGYEKQ